MPRSISEIFVYPIKSLGGISVTSARVLQKGLEHDRRWMLIDEANIFLTQRVHNKMALFKTSFSNGGIKVSYDGHEIEFDSRMEGSDVRAKIWDDEVTVREVSSTHSEWFSKNLDIRVRLVAFPEDNERPVDKKYSIGDDHVSLADAYPLMIVGQSSLDDLNERLKDPVPMNRFRPSVVFTGGEPFEEDNWDQFSMGNLSFAAVKLCKRCVLITVDQVTAIKGAEPLATLSKFRRRDNGVYFGQNIIPKKLGQLSIGDEIVISSHSNRWPS